MSRFRKHDRALPMGARSDGVGGRWQNDSTGQGGDMDRHASTVWCTPVELDRVTIDGLLRYEAVARRIVTREADDATRQGLRVPGLEAQAQDSFESQLESLDFYNVVAKARQEGLAYGGSAVVPDLADGLPTEAPLDLTAIQRVRRFYVADRHSIVPDQWDANRESATFGEVITYRVTRYLPSGMTDERRYHRSRLIFFPGVDLPARVRSNNTGWDGSKFDLVWAAYRNWASTTEYAAEAVTLLTQGVFSSDTITESLRSDDRAALEDRLDALRMAMGVLGDIAIDKSTEDYKIVGRPLAGIGEAMATLERALVASTEMPRSILWGETPGGLNSGSNEGELKIWNGHVASEQTRTYSPRVKPMLRMVFASRSGPTGGILVPINPEWNPLDEPSQLETSQRRLVDAQRREVDIRSQVISTDEARRGDPGLADTYDIDPDEPAPGEGVPPLAADEIQDEGALAFTPEDPPPGENLVSPKQAAQVLGFRSSSPILAMARREEIRLFKVGRQARVAMSEVNAAIRPPRPVGE